MSCIPTKAAVGGKFQSKDGADLMQWLDTNGKVVISCGNQTRTVRAQSGKTETLKSCGNEMWMVLGY